MKTVKTAVVGCGKISDIYFQNMISKFSILEIVCCAASSMESAQKKAAQYHIKAMFLEDILKDESIELIVNLTPPGAHYEIIKSALLAGKHVFTEKALTADLSQAKELIALSDEKKLLLGCAPETFLGGSVQTAKRMVDSGKIGMITGCHASINVNIDMMYPIFRSLTQPGAGIGMDRGIYFLTALCSIIGPIEEVSGFIRTLNPKRTIHPIDNPLKEVEIEIQNENQLTAIVRFTNGTLGTLNFNGNSIFPEVSHITIYGTEGILLLPNANEFGGNVQFISSGYYGDTPNAQNIPCQSKYIFNYRGIGPAELATALRLGKKNRTSKEMAYHIMEVFDGIIKSSLNKRSIPILSTFTIPEAFDDEQL